MAFLLIVFTPPLVICVGAVLDGKISLGFSSVVTTAKPLDRGSGVHSGLLYCVECIRPRI